jgi:hypothetical protein
MTKGPDERITDDPRFDGWQRHHHVYRYALAGRYLDRDWTVVDAPCGTGYAQRFIPHKDYIGLDRHLDHAIDLETYVPGYDYDAWLCFEGIEHLNDPTTLIANAHQAKHFCAFSVPVYPGAELNPFHLRAWTAEQLREAVADQNWMTCHEELQSDRYFLLFQRRVQR